MNSKLLHEFKAEEKNFSLKTFFAKLPQSFLLISFLGLFTGALLGTLVAKFKSSSTLPAKNSNRKKIIKTAGIKNLKLFPDSTEGILKEGGIEGEGSFHLERPGGESQNVYLTSSTIDLSQFVGKKVKVWGKTYKGEKAGWLMDVGYLEVIE